MATMSLWYCPCHGLHGGTSHCARAGPAYLETIVEPQQIVVSVTVNPQHYAPPPEPPAPQ